MKTVNTTYNWLPDLLENLFIENRLDRPDNYETFGRPAVNIIENLPNFVIEIAAPGLKKENFSIEMEEEHLKVSSKKEEKQENNDSAETSKFVKREFDFNGFERVFKLPENIEFDSIEANYENGVLRITLPKKEKKELKKMVEIS